MYQPNADAKQVSYMCPALATGKMPLEEFITTLLLITFSTSPFVYSRWQVKNCVDASPSARDRGLSPGFGCACNEVLLRVVPRTPSMKITWRIPSTGLMLGKHRVLCKASWTKRPLQFNVPKNAVVIAMLRMQRHCLSDLIIASFIWAVGKFTPRHFL